MKKKTNILLWIAFGLGTLIIVSLLVLEYTKGARERAEIVEETHQIVEVVTHEETTTIPVTQPTTTVVTEETETTTVYTVEELAQQVIDGGINGDERKAYLGDRYEEVQKWIDENYIPPVKSVSTSSQQDVNYPTGDVLTPSAGVNYYNGRMETYYNLPMGGVLDIMYSLGYSGEYWVRGDGVKMFGNYVMVACDFGEYPRGSIIETSLGTAIVCDTGSGGWGWTDIAVVW